MKWFTEYLYHIKGVLLVAQSSASMQLYTDWKTAENWHCPGVTVW